MPRCTPNLRLRSGLLIGMLMTCSPILTSTAPAGADKPPETSNVTPDAGRLLTRCFRAMGGETRIERIRDLQIRGTIAIGGQQIGDLKMDFAEGNRSRVEIAIKSGEIASTTVFGCDGTTSWEVEYQNQDTTPNRAMLLTPAELNERVKANNWLGRLLHLAADAGAMQTVGKQEYLGRNCWAVKIPADRRSTLAYFDIETRLINGFRIEVDSPLNQPGTDATPIYLDIVLEDWKAVDEILLFHRVKLIQGEQVITITYDAIRINEGDSDRFALPPAIKELVKTPPTPPTPTPASEQP